MEGLQILLQLEGTRVLCVLVWITHTHTHTHTHAYCTIYIETHTHTQHGPEYSRKPEQLLASSFFLQLDNSASIKKVQFINLLNANCHLNTLTHKTRQTHSHSVSFLCNLPRPTEVFQVSDSSQRHEGKLRTHTM